jgi:hypothetical protein
VSVKELINRNGQRRLRIKEKKSVRFTLPDKEDLQKKVISSSSVSHDEDWSVETWLDQIGMAKYTENFVNHGYCTLPDIQVGGHWLGFLFFSFSFSFSFLLFFSFSFSFHFLFITASNSLL